MRIVSRQPEPGGGLPRGRWACAIVALECDQPAAWLGLGADFDFTPTRDVDAFCFVAVARFLAIAR